MWTITKRLVLPVIVWLVAAGSLPAAELRYSVSWLGNSFSGANDKWVQSFFIDMVTAPDGSCYTWSHWDEGGKRFGIYKDGDVIGNRDVHANSLQVIDKSGRIWKLNVQYVDPKYNEWDFVPRSITCDGVSLSDQER